MTRKVFIWISVFTLVLTLACSVPTPVTGSGTPPFVAPTSAPLALRADRTVYNTSIQDTKTRTWLDAKGGTE
jgi:hypothetical protein